MAMSRPARKKRKKSDHAETAEINFINSKNCQISKSHLDWGRIRPFDFPFMRQLVSQERAATIAPACLPQLATMRRLVQVCSREHDAIFLRAPGPSDRACSAGEQCEGLQLNMPPSERFVPREFLLPTEYKVFLASKQLPCEPRLCLLCKRQQIAKAFFNIKSDNMGVKHGTLLQDFSNVTGLPGEYLLRDCINSSNSVYEGLVAPIVLHSRNAYRTSIVDGVRQYDQWRYSIPQTPRQATQ